MYDVEAHRRRCDANGFRSGLYKTDAWHRDQDRKNFHSADTADRPVRVLTGLSSLEDTRTQPYQARFFSAFTHNVFEKQAAQKQRTLPGADSERHAHCSAKKQRRRCEKLLTERYGPGRIRAEKGAADGGTVHAYCAGQPGSLAAFRHSDVQLSIISPSVTEPSSGSA